MNHESIGEIIRKRRLHIGLSADELARRLGKNRATIYRYENSSIAKLPSSVLEPLARALETTPETLMGWPEAPRDAAAQQHTPALLPIIGRVLLQNGAPLFEDRQGFEYAPIENSDEYFYLRIHSEDMTPAIMPGDLALIKCVSSAHDGDIVLAASHDGEALVRKYALHGNICALQPLNPSCPLLLFDSEPPHIIGKIVETRRRW